MNSNSNTAEVLAETNESNEDNGPRVVTRGWCALPMNELELVETVIGSGGILDGAFCLRIEHHPQSGAKIGILLPFTHEDGPEPLPLCIFPLEMPSEEWVISGEQAEAMMAAQRAAAEVEAGATIN